VQHILPKGFHRIRYDGLHATCKAKQVKGVLTALLVGAGSVAQGDLAHRGTEDLPRAWAGQSGA